MNAASYVFGIISAVVMLIVIIEMLRRGSLRERHSIWWLTAAILALVAGVFPSTLDWAATIVGVQLSSNLVFFVGIGLLFLVGLQHSAELTRLEEKTRILAEKSAMQDLKIIRLESRIHGE
jgi:hypothetical protein